MCHKRRPLYPTPPQGNARKVREYSENITTFAPDTYVIDSLSNNNMPTAKPFVKWAGGKGQLLAQYEDLLPDALFNGTPTVYVEPFVGGGAMLFHVLRKFKGINRAVISDINPDLIATYRAVKDCPAQLVGELTRMQDEYRALKDEDARRDFYLRVREAYNSEAPGGGVSRAAMFVFLNRTCFNGLHRVNSKGLFNVPFGRYANPTICDEGLIEADSRLLQRVEILCGDFALTEKYAEKGAFVYLDPPYRPISATSSFTSYAKEGFDDSEQKRLAQMFARLDKRGCMVMMSNSDSDFLANLYDAFTINKVYAARCVNANGAKRGKLAEIVVRNYKAAADRLLGEVKQAI